MARWLVTVLAENCRAEEHQQRGIHFDFSCPNATEREPALARFKECFEIARET
jgi:hypothetical protein